MKKLVCLLSVVLVLAMMLTSCAPASTQSSDKQEPNVQKTTEQPKADKAKVQIMGPWVVEKPEDEVLNEVVEKFVATNPGIEIELVGCPSADLVQKVQAMATSQTLPDIIITNGPNVAAWKEMGIIENLDNHFDAEYLKGFYTEMLNEFKAGGETYGIPLAAAPFILIIRKDLFEEAGIPVPESFDDIITAAKRLTVDTNNDGKIDRYGFGMMGFPDANTAYRFILTSFAADAPDVYKDSNGKWATKLDSSEGVEAFRFFYDLAIANKTVPPGVTEVDYKNLLNLLATDQVAMAISGPHTIGAIYRQTPGLEGKLMAVPFVGKKTVAWLNSWGVVMSSSSKNKEAAKKFMAFAADNFIEMSKVTKRLTTRIDSADILKNEVPEVAKIIDCSQYAIPMAQVTFRGDVNNVIAKTVNAMLAGSIKTPEDAAKEAGKGVREILDKNNN